MATAAIAWYGIQLAHVEGHSIPDGVAYDSEGRFTTDPAAALGGAIRAFGGYKGAAMALIVETLTRPLVGAIRDDADKKLDWGNLVFAIDPELLADDLASFQADVSELLARVKRLKRLPGVDEILTPGERGDRLYDSLMAAGEIVLDEQIWRDLQAVGASVDDAD